jgi:hypothetical protein
LEEHTEKRYRVDLVGLSSLEVCQGVLESWEAHLSLLPFGLEAVHTTLIQFVEIFFIFNMDSFTFKWKGSLSLSASLGPGHRGQS